MSEEDNLEELDLDLEEEEEEAEEANESLQNSKLLDKIEDKNDLKTDIESEHLTLNEGADIKDPNVSKILARLKKIADANGTQIGADNMSGQTELIKKHCSEKECDLLRNVALTDGTVVNMLEEDLADWYRKKFDKPASISTQQAWEDELNGEMGEISDKRRKHLERKFAQQRDWEARHQDNVKEVPTIKPVETEEPAMAESMHNSELLDKIEAKNDLKTDIESDHLTLTESSMTDGDVDALYDELWSQSQPTDEETEANLQSLNNTADVFESFDELDDTFDEHITEYLKEVYSNIEAYQSTNCTTKGSKLIIEGVIKFQSGREKTTRFTFKTGKRIKESFVLRGTNEGLTSEQSAFRLACKTEGAKLITESFNYKYNIDGTNVKGSTRK